MYISSVSFAVVVAVFIDFFARMAFIAFVAFTAVFFVAVTAFLAAMAGGAQRARGRLADLKLREHIICTVGAHVKHIYIYAI